MTLARKKQTDMLRLLNIAAEVADLSSDRMRKAFVGVVALRQDGTLVHARNGSTPDPEGINPKAHAEFRVLRKAGYGASVYVARLKRDGTFGLAKPCAYCMAALKSRGVELAYYTTENDQWEACRP